jgi:hypothetical protein
MKKFYTIICALLLFSLKNYAQVYSENFDGVGATVASGVLSSGTGQPTLNSNLSIANNWTGYDHSGILTTASDVVNFCSSGKGLRGYAIPNIGSTRKFKLVLNVAAGYVLNMTSIAYKHTSNINNGFSGVIVNGTGYGSSNGLIMQPCPGQPLAFTQARILTGQVTIELIAGNSGTINNAEFTFDDFTINGSLDFIPATHLNFDGTNDYVLLGNVLPASYTKEAWINTSNLSLVNSIISGGFTDGQHTFWVTSSKLSAGHNSSYIAVQDPSVLLANTWYHVAVTYDATTTTMKLYKDGILVATNTNVPAYLSGNMVRVGAFENSANLFKGSIDEVRLWNTALSPDDILRRKNCELQGTESGLVAYYKFNQGIAAGVNTSITTLTATTGSNGILTGFALSGATSNWLAGSPVTTGSTIPTAPSVSTPVTYCQGATASALTATGTSLKWYTAATGGTGSTTAPTPSTAIAGTTSYWVTSNNANGCESARAKIDVTINAKPVVSITGSNPICVGSTTTLSPTTGGTWASSNNVFATVTNAGIVTGVSSGTPTFTFTQTSTGCVSLATSAVTVNAKPVVSITGSNPICVGSTTTLSPTTGGTWTSSNNTLATVTNAGVVTGVSSGTPTFTFTQTSTGCVSLATSAVTVNAKPVVSITGSNPICVGLTTTLSPTTGGTWASSNNALATVTNAGIVTGVSSGTPTFTFTQTSTGCVSLATSAVTVNAIPSAPSVSTPVIYLQNAGASALTATGTNLKWYDAATNGNLLATAPTPSTATVGTTSYWVSQTVNSCESPRAKIDVTVALPATHLNFDGTDDYVSVPSNATIPIGNANYTIEAWIKPSVLGHKGIVGWGNFGTLKQCNAVRLDATGLVNYWWGSDMTVAYTFSLNTWYHVAFSYDGTTRKAYINGVLVQSDFPTGHAVPNANNFRIGSTNNGEYFSGGIDEVRIWNTAQTAADILRMKNCELQGTESGLVAYYKFNQGIDAVTNTGITTLTATTGSNGTLNGFALAGATSNWLAGSPVTTGSTIPTTPSVSTPVTYCQNAPASALTATGTDLKWYTDATGGTGDATAPTPSTTTSGTTSYWVTSTNANGCESTRAKIDLTVNPILTPSVSTAITTGSQTICVGTSVTFTATPTNGGTPTYQWKKDGVDISGATNATFTSTTLANNDAISVEMTSTETCVSSATATSTAITMTVNAIPSAPLVSTLVIYIQGATASALTATGSSLKWYTTATGGVSSPDAPTPSTTTVGTTSYWVSQTVGTCESPRAKIDVTVALPATHLNFGNSNDAISIPDNNTLDFTNQYTFETWINISNYQYGTLISKFDDDNNNRGWMINMGESGDYTKLSVVHSAAGTWTNPIQWNTNFSPSLNTWYHVAVTFDGTLASNNLKLFVNGTLQSQANWAYSLVPNSANVYVGGYDGAGNGLNAGANIRNINARMDEVRLWNIALNPNDILRRKNCELQGTESGLVAYYKFNQGIDAVTNTGITTLTATTGSNGTLTGFTLSGATSNWLAGSPVTTGNTIPTTPSVSTPVTYCQNATASALTATGTDLKWYTVATGGTGSATAPTPSTTTAGTTSYWVTSSNANGCESARAEIVVTINAIPSAPTVSTPVTYLQNATASALTAAGTDLKWYTAATGGTGSATAPTPSTATVGTTSYWVSQTIGTCESPRAEVVVTVNISTKTLPYMAENAGFSPTATLNNFSTCQSSASVTAYGSEFDGSVWYDGNFALYVNSNYVGNYTGLNTIDISSYMPITSVAVSSNSWDWSYVKIVVNITSPISSMPTATPSVSNINLCQNATVTPLTANLTSTGTSLKWYTTVDGGGYNATAPTPSSATFGTVSYWVAQANSSGCESERAKIDVTTVNCNDIHTGTSGCYTATLTNVQGNSWFNFVSPSGIIASLNPNGMNLGTVTVEVSDASGAVTFNGKQYLGRSVNFMSSNYASGVNMPSNYSLRLYYMDSELTEYNSATSGTFALSDFNMMWKQGGTGCSLPTYGGIAEGMVEKATVVEAEYGTSNNGFYLQIPLNHFTIFAATASSNAPLPIELLSFNGYAKDNNNILVWQTATEQNANHFDIQHSVNGLDFETIGQIKAKGQAAKYTFTHQNPAVATHYYRLKMVDKDSTFEMSKVISLDKNEAKSLKIYPNPTQNSINIITSDYTQPMRLYSINGALIMNKTQTTEQLDMSALPTGMYFLHVGSDVLKVIKE